MPRNCSAYKYCNCVSKKSVNIGRCNEEACEGDEGEYCGWDLECTELSAYQLTPSSSGGFYTNKKCSGYKYKCYCRDGHCRVSYPTFPPPIPIPPSTYDECGAYDKITESGCGCN